MRVQFPLIIAGCLNPEEVMMLQSEVLLSARPSGKSQTEVKSLRKA